MILSREQTAEYLTYTKQRTKALPTLCEKTAIVPYTIQFTTYFTPETSNLSRELTVVLKALTTVLWDVLYRCLRFSL
jgi:hypothetical protein